MPFVQIVDFIGKRSRVVNFFLMIFGLTLVLHSGRNYEPNYMIKASK